MGRNFVEEDPEAGAEPVAIIGEGLRQRRYGGDPNALAVTRVLAGLLFGVGTGDPATLTAVALILGAVTASACFFPARRATRLDPMSAIRFE